MNYTERFNPPENLYTQSTSPTQQPNRRTHPNSTVTPHHREVHDSLLSLFEGSSAHELLELNRYGTGQNFWDHALLDPTKLFLKAPGKSLRREFVELGWALASAFIQEGRPNYDRVLAQVTGASGTSCPTALIHLIELLHTGSLIVDDIEDQSLTRRGQPCLHRQIGLAPALNIGNWLYFVSAHMIERLECSPRIKASIYTQLNRVMLRCHQGQAIDVSCKVTHYSRADIPSLTETSTRLKTGVLVGFAVQLGSLILDLDEEQSEQLYQFGERIGLALQMYDDLSGFLNDKKWHKGCEDIGRQRLTWVWSWLAQHPELSDDSFDDLMSQLKSLWLDPTPPIAFTNSGVIRAKGHTENDHEKWLHKAQALREQCRPLLISAENQIKREITDALFNLSAQLQSERADKVAQAAVLRLQRSYL